MHDAIAEQGEWLKQVVMGFFNYHAVPTNGRALAAFRQGVIWHWGRTLRRRSQTGALVWDRIEKIADDWLPKPTILHPCTRGGSRMRESRTYGSVRGASSNGRPTAIAFSVAPARRGCPAQGRARTSLDCVAHRRDSFSWRSKLSPDSPALSRERRISTGIPRFISGHILGL